MKLWEPKPDMAEDRVLTVKFEAPVGKAEQYKLGESAYVTGALELFLKNFLIEKSMYNVPDDFVFAVTVELRKGTPKPPHPAKDGNLVTP